MPSVPAFAGDLHADDSLGTRAIMEYQYQSICRGGHSIIEEIHKAGVPDASEYIRFYNLRNYDRLNIGSLKSQVENVSGINYENARRQHDDMVGAGYDGRGEETGAQYGQPNRDYERYQEAAQGVDDSEFDSVSACYMDGGPSIRDVPWGGSEESEMNAFVSEGTTRKQLLIDHLLTFARTLHPLKSVNSRRSYCNLWFRKSQRPFSTW
jgi:phospholipase D1/2